MLQISKHVKQNILIHKRLNHPCVVQLKEVRTAASQSCMHRPLHRRTLQCCICSCQGCSSTAFQDQTANAQGATCCTCLFNCCPLAGWWTWQGLQGMHLEKHNLASNPAHFGPPLYLQVFLTPEFLAIAMDHAAGGDSSW